MKFGRLFLSGMSIVLLLPGNAQAYIDPGSGALVWQMLLAAFFGLCFYARKTRNWIIDCIKRIVGFKKKTVNDENR